MSTIVTRAGKGSPLTHNEVDANFTNLNADKLEAADVADLATGAASATDNAIARFDGVTGKVIQNSAVTLDDNGVFTVPVAATPTAPSSGVRAFGKSRGGQTVLGYVPATGNPFSLQSHIGEVALAWWQASGDGVADTQSGMSASSTGTSSTVTWATTNFRTRMRWREWLVTVAATTAVAGFRSARALFTVGGGTNSGGFTLSLIWSPATGVTNGSHRAFAGMNTNTGAPTDVNPSTLRNMVGMAYDDTDTNIQFMHNDGAGTATKIDLGASFPKPSADREKVYRIQLYSPPGATQSVSYLVSDLETGASASGTVTTDLPAVTTGLNCHAYISVGGVSSVVGLGVRVMTLETDF